MTEPLDVNVDELRRRARRRLVGAVVLALAAAVFVPMLLESDPRPLGEDIAVRIPPVDDSKFVSRLNGNVAKDAGKSSAIKAETAKADAARNETAKSEAVRAEAARVAAAKIDAPVNDAAGTTAANAESVKADASGSAPNGPPKRTLADAEQKMLGGGTRNAPVSNVKAPPSASMAKADVAVATPAAASPPKGSVAMADATQDFSVQLAAFADDKGANSLANKLKKAGYAAYTEPLTTSRGTLWRVRVGPFAARDAALAARDKLKGDGYAGIVAPSK